MLEGLSHGHNLSFHSRQVVRSAARDVPRSEQARPLLHAPHDGVPHVLAKWAMSALQMATAKHPGRKPEAAEQEPLTPSAERVASLTQRGESQAQGPSTALQNMLSVPVLLFVAASTPVGRQVHYTAAQLCFNPHTSWNPHSHRFGPFCRMKRSA